MKRYAGTRIDKATIDRIREIQAGNCVYCGCEFGSYVERRGSYVLVSETVEHFVPYALTRDNSASNLFLACTICNRIKNASIFDSISEARSHILKRRKSKGYHPI